MSRIERAGAGDAKAIVREITFDDVRQSFLVRLHSEQARLAFLIERMVSVRFDPDSTFSDLEVFAHRLQGAAAVFQMPELRADSKALESAAAAAALEHSPVSELQVRKTMQILASRLVGLNRGTQLSLAPVLPAAEL